MNKNTVWFEIEIQSKCKGNVKRLCVYVVIYITMKKKQIDNYDKIRIIKFVLIVLEQ